MIAKGLHRLAALLKGVAFNAVGIPVLEVGFLGGLTLAALGWQRTGVAIAAFSASMGVGAVMVLCASAWCLRRPAVFTADATRRCREAGKL